ncbi:MAG: transglutaminase-like domain-containing protein, partial [Candidatus Zixiibacteriota bacterium]
MTSRKLIQFIIVAALIFILPGFAVSQSEEPKVDIKAMSLEIAGTEGSSMIRAGRLIDWMNKNFDYTSTDYKKRTVEEIIENRHGNCAELAKALMALLEASNIPSRWVAEINIQAENEEREVFAKKMVVEKGPQCSVFGLMHNDHRWLEIYNDSLDNWIPMDPTLHTWGLDQ